MCEFCLKHGEGKKWYLRAENYSADLLSDARRRRFVEEFFAGDSLREAPRRLEALDLEAVAKACGTTPDEIKLEIDAFNRKVITIRETLC